MPPPADLGNTQHAGLAAAMAADKDAHTSDSTGRVLAQLMYGYVILDSTVSPDGRPGFGVVPDSEGRRGVTVYTSNEAFHAARPGTENVSAMVIPAYEALTLVARSDLDFLLLDSGYSMMKFERPAVEAAADGPRNVRLRTALALAPEDVHAAVLDVIAHPEADEQLINAVYPQSIPEDGDLTHAVPMTSTNAEGNKVLLVFTSFTEAMLATPGRYVALPIANLLRIAAHPSIGGILINPATSGEVVLRAELPNLPDVQLH